MHRMLRRALLISALATSLILGFIALAVKPRILYVFDKDLVFKEYQYFYKDAPFTGIGYEAYRNGKLKHVLFVYRGKLIGREYQWHENGQRFTEWSYSNGLPHGVWKMWYEDGSAKSLRNYVNGQPHGEDWAWHANGQISDYNVWENGQEITHKSWISDGTPYYNYVYQNGVKVGVKGGEFCKRLEKIRK